MLGKKCGFAFPGFPGLGKPQILGCHNPVCHSCLWAGQAGLSACTKRELPEGSLPMSVAVLSGCRTLVPDRCPAHPSEAQRLHPHLHSSVPAEIFALSLYYQQATKKLLHIGIDFPTVK